MNNTSSIKISQKNVFYAEGMHCKSCVLYLEDKIGSHPEVLNVKANLNSLLVEVEGEFRGKSKQDIANMLTDIIKENGYTLLIDQDKMTKRKNYEDFKLAIPIALGFLILFVVLQKIGLLNIIGGENITYGTAFVIGIVASLSTCMAVVGGLLLSMSASFAKGGDKTKPQILFHLGRLISFFVFGGIIGAIGSAFTLNATGSFIIGIVIGLVMLLLGINLLDIFHWAKKFGPTVPKFIAKRAHGFSKINHSLTPFIVGIITFFLPCGFTQSMQLYTLSLGDFLSGAIFMLVYSLGTLPILLLISFTSMSMKDSTRSGVFFKSVGLIIIMFALFNILNSLASIGIIKPIFSF